MVLVAYLEWGTDSVKHLNGIFAFGIWDERKETLFLTRDRLGVKPLFYYPLSSGLIFASEPKALLRHPRINPEVTAEGLAEILVMGPSRTPGHGVYHGMHELKPGHVLYVNRREKRQERYWNVTGNLHREGVDETAETLRWLLKDIVHRQLISDVPVCTLLSGGLDSTALTAFASHEFELKGMGPLHTYSVDYVDNEQFFQRNRFQPDSDDHWVDYASNRLGTVHHRILLSTEQLVETLKDAVHAKDLPGMTDIDSSLYLFCREIKKDFKVALSGEAADEIFGGYPWFRENNVTEEGFPWIRSLPERMRLFSPDLVHRLQPAEYLHDKFFHTLQETPLPPDEEKEKEENKRHRQLSYLNIKWFMATLLERKDRMSMANGLEVRVPFCDHRLVEYAYNIPWKLKNWGEQEKGILRRALKEVVPRRIVNRRKSPYPRTHHPYYLELVKGKMREVIEDTSSPLRPLLNLKEVCSRLDTPGRELSAPWFGQLMGEAQLWAYLYQTDYWLRNYRVKLIL